MDDYTQSPGERLRELLHVHPWRMLLFPQMCAVVIVVVLASIRPQPGTNTVGVAMHCGHVRAYAVPVHVPPGAQSASGATIDEATVVAAATLPTANPVESAPQALATEVLSTDVALIVAAHETVAADDPQVGVEVEAESDEQELTMPSRPSVAAIVTPAVQPPQAAACVACEAANHQYGTKLHWTNSVQAAAKQAAQQSKLVYLIQISGNFAKPGFT